MSTKTRQQVTPAQGSAKKNFIILNSAGHSKRAMNSIRVTLWSESARGIDLSANEAAENNQGYIDLSQLQLVQQVLVETDHLYGGMLKRLST